MGEVVENQKEALGRIQGRLPVDRASAVQANEAVGAPVTLGMKETLLGRNKSWKHKHKS